MSQKDSHFSSQRSSQASPAMFRTTHWSVVLQAGDVNSSDSFAAMETLCKAYWRPIFFFIRARGFNAADAQDMTQEFFHTVLESGTFGRANPDRGRFRAFLKVSVKNFLANALKKAGRVKRGGGYQFCSLEDLDQEPRGPDMDFTSAPDKIYEVQWAKSVLHNSLARLKEEMEARGALDRFELYKQYLVPSRNAPSYAETAEVTGLTEQTIKSGVHRFRERVRSFFLSEVADTLADPRDIEEEARQLMRALADS